MTVPTNIPETPIVHTNHKSFQGSKDTNTSISMEILQHVLKTVMDIKNDEEVKSFSHWMSYRGYDNFTDICVNFYHILDSIHDHGEYKVNGLRCSLKFSIMNKIRLFINWMTTKMTDGNFKPYAELLISLTDKKT